MIVQDLLKQIETSIDIMKSNIFDDVNDKFVIDKLVIIAEYLKIRLSIKHGLTYSDILNNKEFQDYISDLWTPASFTGYYNPHLNKLETESIYIYIYIYNLQDSIKEITRDIENGVKQNGE